MLDFAIKLTEASTALEDTGPAGRSTASMIGRGLGYAAVIVAGLMFGAILALFAAPLFGISISIC